MTQQINPNFGNITTIRISAFNKEAKDIFQTVLKNKNDALGIAHGDELFGALLKDYIANHFSDDEKKQFDSVLQFTTNVSNATWEHLDDLSALARVSKQDAVKAQKAAVKASAKVKKSTTNTKKKTK